MSLIGEPMDVHIWGEPDTDKPDAFLLMADEHLVFLISLDEVCINVYLNLIGTFMYPIKVKDSLHWLASVPRKDYGDL